MGSERCCSVVLHLLLCAILINGNLQIIIAPNNFQLFVKIDDFWKHYILSYMRYRSIDRSRCHSEWRQQGGAGVHQPCPTPQRVWEECLCSWHNGWQVSWVREPGSRLHRSRVAWKWSTSRGNWPPGPHCSRTGAERHKTTASQRSKMGGQWKATT